MSSILSSIEPGRSYFRLVLNKDKTFSIFGRRATEGKRFIWSILLKTFEGEALSKMIDFLKNVPRYDPYLKELEIYTTEEKSLHGIDDLSFPKNFEKIDFSKVCTHLDSCEIWREFVLPDKRIENRFIKYVGFRFDSELFEIKAENILVKLYEMFFFSLFLSLIISFVLSKIFTGSIYKVLSTIRTLSENVDSDNKIPNLWTKELNELSFAFNNLFEKLKRKREQTKEMAKDILKIADVERRNISRDLHDSVGQLILAANLKIKSNKVKEAQELLLLANEELRNIYDELEPRSLEKMNLHSAIEWYLLKFFSKEFAYYINVKEAEDLSEDMRIQVYRIIQEAISNASKHSSDCEFLEIKIEKSGNRMKIIVENDIAKENMKEKSRDGFGRGLKNIKLRAESLAGSLDVKSSNQKFSLIVTLIVNEEIEG